ncbi:MAG: choice-of-anchor D domain-containing protein [Candidatus Bipolaricaulota bacterium]|nr:choice-of-anchor D domain-containing protein [Candidatus Bipolaricaulota bacterium]MDW8031674.1 choice-of-anchor D domain-containing protein [Candidatus Bipolaricaulota bacterium]
MNTDEAQAVQLAGGQQLLIPFGEDAHLVWTRTTTGQTAALGLICQGNKTLNVSGDGQERIIRFLPEGKVQRLLGGLRQRSKFQEFERKLAQRGKRIGKILVLLDETNNVAILGVANAGDEAKIVYQVRIKLKPDKDDEPDGNAEPQIQATACGQATGEAVPAGAQLEPLSRDPGEGGDFGGGYYGGSEGGDYGPQICTSQWGYDYHCTSRFPMLSLSLSGPLPTLTVPQTFVNQQSQGSFVIWNSGGGRLTGTVSVSAPFSIASGASFNLLPGQPQEVVVRFSSANPGSFSRSVSISSNGGNQTITATSVAHKISFSPAQVDFGSGLLVLREQCNQMGACGLGTEKVGLPIEKTLTVKNEGTVSVTLTLSTSAPYRVVSALPTLSPGQSGQVTLRFDPNESGNFTGMCRWGLVAGRGV